MMSRCLLQSKLKLEMAQEQMRQKHAKELDEKEEEMEDMRCSTQKKVQHQSHEVQYNKVNPLI